MDAKNLIRHSTETALADIVNFDKLYKQLNRALTNQIPIVPKFDWNESELLALYITNHSFMDFDEDIFIRNVCHKFRLDYRNYNFCQCALVVVRYLGKLRPNTEQVEDTNSNYRKAYSTCESIADIHDVDVILNELALWCKGNGINFYDDFSETLLYDVLCKYISDVLHKDKINWNKPDIISLHNFQRCDDLYNEVVKEYVREIHDGTSGRVLDLAIGVIKKNLKYVPEDLKPTANVTIDWEEIKRVRMAAHKVWNNFDFSRFLLACEMVFGKENTEKSIYWHVEFEVTLIPIVAYYFSSKYFYEDYLIDKKKVRV